LKLYERSITNGQTYSFNLYVWPLVISLYERAITGGQIHSFKYIQYISPFLFGSTRKIGKKNTGLVRCMRFIDLFVRSYRAERHEGMAWAGVLRESKETLGD